MDKDILFERFISKYLFDNEKNIKNYKKYTILSTILDNGNLYLYYY